ncbi:uncharacterized protein LOC110442377 [Mizuhopecten yessoensis]|uniref:Uncharacterized protein n=1 Tax=Mizuhopecten yessoensis TaxID=6573 RepID=A0A210PHE4_MIZYE|nr:uncharacterized protein LOC110442377 [Mizuhopecten yessoensis]XP_021341634.1 uncharacterized protein LOC110442377 [Mizuhopecten yessoensis]OWF35903.1 hypothetical protein KP79_PYT09726 [Mizuhopecten yessoensis]
MGDRIYRTNFLELDGLTFSFNMTNHLDPLVSEDDSLTAICEKISSYHQLMFPNWTRLRADFRIIRITPENELFEYLDANSRGKLLNWLIFSRVGDQIIVTHFGPFGKKKENDFEDNVDQTRLSLQKLRDIWLQVRSSSKPQSQKETELKAIRTKILEEFWGLIKASEEQIEAKKRELKEVTEFVFESEDKRARIAHQIEKITIKTGWVLVRQIVRALVMEITIEIAKVVAKMAAKQTAKQGAKGASKGVAKTTAKAVPFLGLVVGTGFAIWRLAEGDVAGAGLEIASGAASCAPGAGTATALAIDASLLVKDVKNVIDIAAEKREKMEALKAVTERIERELIHLFEECEKAKAEYDFVRKVLGDPGYDFKKLERDIKVVDKVLRELHNN